MSQVPLILDSIRTSPNVSYLLDDQKEFAYCNRAWDQFALANEAPELARGAVIGTNLFDWIPTPMHAFYRDAFKSVESSTEFFEHSYECPSPVQRRLFQMFIYPVEPLHWFLVVNRKVVEHEHPSGPPPDLSVYTDKDGIVTVCSNCRCARRADNTDEWNFVKEFLLKGTPNLSHGICPACNLYFWRA